MNSFPSNQDVKNSEFTRVTNANLRIRTGAQVALYEAFLEGPYQRGYSKRIVTFTREWTLPPAQYYLSMSPSDWTYYVFLLDTPIRDVDKEGMVRVVNMLIVRDKDARG